MPGAEVRPTGWSARRRGGVKAARPVPAAAKRGGLTPTRSAGYTAPAPKGRPRHRAPTSAFAAGCARARRRPPGLVAGGDWVVWFGRW